MRRRETQANRGRRHSKKGEGPGSSLSGILRRGGRGCDAKWVPVTFHTISFRRGKGGGRRRGSDGCHAAAPAQCPDVTMLLGTGRREDTCTLLLLSEEQRVDPLHLLRGVPNHSISVRPVRDEQRRCVSAAWGCHARLRAGTGETRWQSTANRPVWGAQQTTCLPSKAVVAGFAEVAPPTDVTIRRMQQLASFSYKPRPKTHKHRQLRKG